jgi:uncharacterized protein (TIGR02186 family)
VRRLVAIITVLLAASAAHAERLTVAVSSPEVKIDSAFTGTTLTVFGVVEKDAGAAASNPDYKVAVLVVGPGESVVARRQDRVLGIWVNHAAQMILRPPSFYSLTTTDPLDTLANPAVLDRLGVGFENIPFAYEGHPTINDPAADEFRAAYIRLKQKQGLFNQEIGVNFLGDLIFRAGVHLPANIATGRYTVLAYLFADGELIANAQDSVEVSTTGFEATMASFARSQSLLYGIICAALALFVGWLGGVIFRRD